MNYKNVKIDKTAKNCEAVRNHRWCNNWSRQLRAILQRNPWGWRANRNRRGNQHPGKLHDPCQPRLPVHIGNNVTIGHNAVIHSCTIGDRTLIGMGVIILDGAKIGSDCIIGAGSLVTKNTIIPDGSLVMGSPAKIKRNLTWEEKIGIVENSNEYVTVSEEMWKQGVL